VGLKFKSTYRTLSHLQVKVCRAEKYFVFRLVYEKSSDPKNKKCQYKCSEIQQETDEDGEVYEYCEVREKSIYEEYTFFLADSNQCEESKKNCWNCTNELSETKTFDCMQEDGKT